jgi:ABC-2 type transport system ATP-binding protein
MDAVEVRGLRKVYRRGRNRENVALNALDLTVPEGGIFGLLGPNGAGKTTTFRCLLGLARAEGGTMTVLGRRIPNDLPEVVHEVGSVLEGTGFYPTFTIQDSLAFLAGIERIPRNRVDDAVDALGLGARRTDPIGSLSTGLRRRVAIAAAVLKNPRLVLLDEPLNGLDPSGMVDVRSWLVEFAKSGRTVVISSHDLHEVELMADNIAIVNHGDLAYSGTVSGLVSADSMQACVLRLPELEAAEAVLSKSFVVIREGDHLVVQTRDGAQIAKLLSKHGMFPTEIRSVGGDLESAFLRVMTGSDSE